VDGLFDDGVDRAEMHRGNGFGIRRSQRSRGKSQHAQGGNQRD